MLLHATYFNYSLIRGQRCLPDMPERLVACSGQYLLLKLILLKQNYSNKFRNAVHHHLRYHDLHLTSCIDSMRAYLSSPLGLGVTIHKHKFPMLCFDLIGFTPPAHTTWGNLQLQTRLKQLRGIHF